MRGEYLPIRRDVLPAHVLPAYVQSRFRVGRPQCPTRALQLLSLSSLGM
jgi:hypothetical protein